MTTEQNVSKNLATLINAAMIEAARAGMIKDNETYMIALKICAAEAVKFLQEKGR